MAISNLSLQALDTQAVNEPRPMDYTWANMPLLAIAIVTNFWAAVVIRRKEKTCINSAIIFDCGVNILTMLLFTILRSPWLVPGQHYALCSAYRVLLDCVIVWNRIILLGIALFRYFMICHAVACHNIGAKLVWRVVLAAVICVSLLGGCISWFYRGDSRIFLRCLGMEETFR